MKENNLLKEKGLQFGIRTAKMAAFLVKNYPISVHPIFTQMLKSGTSIGANICESEFAESLDDFKHKLKISPKEANESEYWIEVLHESSFLNDSQYESILVDCKELIKLLTASINTVNKKTNNY